jgi:hypothetical protein
VEGLSHVLMVKTSEVAKKVSPLYTVLTSKPGHGPPTRTLAAGVGAAALKVPVAVHDAKPASAEFGGLRAGLK